MQTILIAGESFRIAGAMVVIGADGQPVAFNSVAVASANFVRPADATPYASGDLVANSVTAGSVAALALVACRIAGSTVSIRRARLKKSGTGVTNASFRIHLFALAAAPVSAAGDNAAWSAPMAGYLGAIDVVVDRVFSDGAVGIGTPVAGSEITAKLTAASTTIYGLIEARGAYTPGSAEAFTVELEVFQN